MTEGATNPTELEKLSPSVYELNTYEKRVDPNTRQRWKFLMEPALVGAMIAINLGQTSLQNFYLQTACSVDLMHPISDCEMSAGGPHEAASQKIVSGVNISRSFIGSLISTVVLLFVGPWSDCSGRRKPLLIMPLVGMCIMTTGVLLMITFPGASTVQVLYAVQIPISIGGNFGLLLAAAFSHIGDVCHATGLDVTRTMGTHRAAIQVAHVVGALGGPMLYRQFGFYGVFPIVLLLQLASLLYIIWAVKDVNVNSENRVSVLNWRLPFQAVQCLFKKREGNRRVIIILLLIVALGDRMILSAEVLLSYMFYRRKFQWDDIWFGGFLAYRNIVSFCGTLIILMVFKRRLRLSDEMVGMLSCLSYIFATTGLIAATTTISVFLLPLIGIISQGSQVVQRPILNKQILPTEQGKIYSVLGALESATQTISSPLYSLLYKKTVLAFPDAWLLPGIGLVVLQFLAYFCTEKLGRRHSSRPKSRLLEAEIRKDDTQLNVKVHSKKTNIIDQANSNVKTNKNENKTANNNSIGDHTTGSHLNIKVQTSHDVIKTEEKSPIEKKDDATNNIALKTEGQIIQKTDNNNHDVNI